MGGVPNASGPSPTLGSLGPSHQWRHKSRTSLQGLPCAHGVAGTPQGEVRDRAQLIELADQEAQGRVLLQETEDLLYRNCEILIQSALAVEEAHVIMEEERWH